MIFCRSNSQVQHRRVCLQSKSIFQKFWQQYCYFSIKNLYLVDGGEDGQNIPISPLLHRNVSAIFAFDNSNDVLNWPDGTSLVKTYERQFSSQGNGIAFPYVPDQYTFRNLNLTSKPTFLVAMQKLDFIDKGYL